MTNNTHAIIWIGCLCFLCFVVPFSVAYFIIDKDTIIRRWFNKRKHNNRRKKKEVKQPRIIDYSFDNRGWGHNFTLSTKLKNDGTMWSIIGHCRGIQAGDILVMGLKEDGSENKVYTVKGIEYLSNPTDMYKATIEHLPICKMADGIHAKINSLL